MPKVTNWDDFEDAGDFERNKNLKRKQNGNLDDQDKNDRKRDKHSRKNRSDKYGDDGQGSFEG